MERACPRCKRVNRAVARFCAHCGLALAAGLDGSCEAGRIRHPQPLTPAEGFEPCQQAADLYFRREAAWGGQPLLGTESVGVILFNAGYPLQEVVLELRGEDEKGKRLFAVEQTVELLPRGEEVGVEVPSYELPAPLRALSVSLLSAEFGPEP
jgi:hypothetical protein